MRISFLCSSFEPGRDGVGDYVRQFAIHLTQLGHSCQVIALADRHIETVASISDTDGFEAIRFPFAQWRSGDIGAARIALDHFNPDWVSLQMVCYGYENRGLLFNSAALFGQLKTAARRHMMFHELWIGETESCGIKDRLLGRLQKLLLLRATKSWAPDIVQTSNPVYRELLRRNGIATTELPLPGNVPVQQINPEIARQWLLNKLGLVERAGTPFVLAGLFGSIHPEWEHANGLNQLSDYSQSAGKSLAVVQIGRAGLRGDVIWKDLQRQLAGRASLHTLGELSAEEVSIALQALDLGIATSPWSLTGKSGSAATMLEHGLPLVVTRMDSRLRNGPTPDSSPHPRIYKGIDSDFVTKLRTERLGKERASSQHAVYLRFIDALTKP